MPKIPTYVAQRGLQPVEQPLLAPGAAAAPWLAVAEAGREMLGTSLGTLSLLAKAKREREAIEANLAEADARLDLKEKVQAIELDFSTHARKLRQEGADPDGVPTAMAEWGKERAESDLARLKYPAMAKQFLLAVREKLHPKLLALQDESERLKYAATMSGYEIQHATTVNEAAKALGEGRPDVAGSLMGGVVTDLKKLAANKMIDISALPGIVARRHMTLEEQSARQLLANPGRRQETLDALQSGTYHTPFTAGPVLSFEQQEKLANEALSRANAVHERSEREAKERANLLFGDLDTTVSQLLAEGTDEAKAEALRTLQSEPNRRLYIGGGREERYGMLLREASKVEKTTLAERDDPVTEGELNRLIFTPTAEERRLSPSQVAQRVNDATLIERKLTPNTQRTLLQVIESRAKKTDEQSTRERSLWDKRYQLIDDSLKTNIAPLADLVPNVNYTISEAKREALSMTHPDVRGRSMSIEDWERKRLPVWIARAGGQVETAIEQHFSALPVTVRQKPVGPEMLKELETLGRTGTLKGQAYTDALRNYDTLARLSIARRRQQMAERDLETKRPTLMPALPGQAPKAK